MPCAVTWGNCRGTVGETVGWRMCPSQPSALGCCWLPGAKMEKKKCNIISPIRLNGEDEETKKIKN